MKIKKIVLAGGTGFVGNYLRDQFTQLGYEIIIISRNRECVQWNNEAGMIQALENAELVINLAGKSVNCRYTEKNKQEILKSRTETTEKLGKAILKCKNPPELWINSSTATIYRHAQDRPMTEKMGEIGSGFSVDVAKQWEESFFRFRLSKTRQAALRMAIVLGKEGGVFPVLANLVKFGLGGKQGSGLQKFSWIHIDDLFQLILFIQKKKNLTGVFNCSAPNPVDNSTLMCSLRSSMKIPIGLPSPKWLLEVGSIFIQTETELVLKSRWVLPERIVGEGFNFKYPLLKDALDKILKRA
jgi:uncharacterized protein